MPLTWKRPRELPLKGKLNMKLGLRSKRPQDFVRKRKPRKLELLLKPNVRPTSRRPRDKLNFTDRKWRRRLQNGEQSKKDSELRLKREPMLRVLSGKPNSLSTELKWRRGNKRGKPEWLRSRLQERPRSELIRKSRKD